MNYFTFDGIDSRDYNTYIATSNAFDAPGREDEVIKVPGSNNIYYLTEGTYKPFDIKLYCYIPSNMQVKTDDLRNFLLSKGTCTYTEAIRPGEFRVARFIEAYELDVSDRVSAAFVLTFKAQPQRYLTTNTPITTTATADTTTDTTLSLSTVPTPITISLNGNTTQEGSSGKNLFDSGFFLSAGWTLTNGYYTGTALALKNYSNSVGGVFPNGLNASRITISFDAYKEGTSANTVRVYIGYTDSTSSWVGVTATTSTHFSLTSTSGKTVSNVTFSYGTNATTYIKNFQIELGATETAFEPHISPTNPQVIHNVSGDNTVNVLGKNLIKINDYTTRTHNGMTFKALNDGGVLVNGTTTGNAFFNLDYEQGKCPYPKGVPLTISGGAMIGSYALEIDVLINGSTSARATTSGVTFTIPTTATEAFTRVRVPNSGVTIDNVIVHPLLEVGSTATTYEPYTRQSYPLYLPVENLNKIADVKSGWLPTSGAYPTTNGSYPNAQYLIVPLNKGETCYLSGTTNIKGRVRAMNTSAVIGTVTANTTYYTTTADQSSGFKEGSITALQDLILGILFMDGYASSGGNELIIAKGTNVQNYSIELNKIGTYQDYIYKNGGKWYLHKAIGKSIINDISWTYSSGSASFYAVLANMTPAGLSRAQALSPSYPFNSGDKFIATTSTQLRLIDSSYTDVTSLKSAMGNVEIYYQLATPTNTEITDTTLINQLNNIEKAYSYNGTTNILQVSNDNGFMLEVVSLHSNDVSSDYKGEPIITVNSTGLIYFNGCVIKVNQAPMTINSQTMQAYNGVVNLNNYIEANDFPMIEAGTNVIGSEMPLSIVPNYWKL